MDDEGKEAPKPAPGFRDWSCQRRFRNGVAGKMSVMMMMTVNEKDMLGRKHVDHRASGAYHLTLWNVTRRRGGWRRESKRNERRKKNSDERTKRPTELRPTDSRSTQPFRPRPNENTKNMAFNYNYSP